MYHLSAKAIWAQSDAPLERTEAATAPCLLFSTCLTQLQQINRPGPRRNCGDGTNPQTISNNDYTALPVDVSEVPQELVNAQVGKEPVQWWKLILFGVGVAPVEFFISTGLHEGAHVLAAAASGAEITSYKPYPHVMDGNFYFGSMSYRGSLTPAQDILLSAAPMILDTAVLGTYGGLVLSGNTSNNAYVKMGLWVFAAGHWVDMANHMIGRNENTDSAKIREVLRTNYGFSEVESQLAVRGTQGVILAVGGYFLYRGMRDLIESNRAPAAASRPAKTSREREEERARMNLWERHEMNLAPMGSPEEGSLGLMFSGRF